jgi:hypothetical protein
LDSQTSSKPPSSDLLKKSEKKKETGKKKRKPGGQPGHEGKTRKGFGRVDRIEILKAEQWWYFLDHPEIPPDNNLAERALRLAVTKRKVRGGSRSMERFQDTANNLSVIQTCRFQGRSVVNFFTSALRASVGIEEQPSLVPDFCT